MASWLKITGTQVGKFILGLTGVTLKNNAGNLDVRNNADTAYADVNLDSVTLHGGTYYNTIQPSPSQTMNVVLTLPVDDGTAGQVLSTDGTGILSWVAAANTAPNLTADTTSFAFGSGSTITAFTLPANAVVDSTVIIVDSAFDGTPTLSVGYNGGSASYYAGSGDNLLTVADRYQIPCQEQASVSTQSIELYYSAGGASTGSGRVIVYYSVPA
jgi:hypothetical protein